MKVKFNLGLDVSLSGVEVEAKSYEEALKKLCRMSVEDLIEEGYVESYETYDEEGEVTDKTVEVKVTNIDYDIDEDNLDDGVTVEDALKELPSEVTLTIDGISEDDDLVSLTKEYAEDKTGTFIKDFDYEIVKEY